MPRYISVGGNSYGIWSNEDGSAKGDAVPATIKAADSTIATKIDVSQKEHIAQAKRKN